MAHDMPRRFVDLALYLFYFTTFFFYFFFFFVFFELWSSCSHMLPIWIRILNVKRVFFGAWQQCGRFYLVSDVNITISAYLIATFSCNNPKTKPMPKPAESSSTHTHATCCHMQQPCSEADEQVFCTKCQACHRPKRQTTQITLRMQHRALSLLSTSLTS